MALRLYFPGGAAVVTPRRLQPLRAPHAVRPQADPRGTGLGQGTESAS